LVRSRREIPQIRLLIDSIRSFGGALRQCPVWIFEVNPQNAPCDSLKGENISVFTLNVPESIKSYLYGDKVYAGRQAEDMADPNTRTLIWIDPSCLIIQPPVLYDLSDKFDAAVRPVHIQNVGLNASAPLDGFWNTICESIGVTDIQTSVETFVDRKIIRSYFNSHAFAINPAKKVCDRWFKAFEMLVCDQEFQKTSCQDQQHRIFLHQALYSALITAFIHPDRLNILPPDYNYPYNLHGSVPPERKAQALNDLVTITYESRTLAPDTVTDIHIVDPLKTWLSDHYTFI
jgi:hypothetical protein